MVQDDAGAIEIRRRAVVVDDDPQIRRLVAMLLELDLDLEVAETCGSASEAVMAVERHQPDLVVLDHFLCDRVTGLALAPRLKEVAPQTRIVMFSAVLDSSAEGAPGVDAAVNKMGVELLPALVASLLGMVVLEQLDRR